MIQKATTADKAKTIILKQGGIIRTQEAIKQGIHPRTLYQLRDSGELEQLSRGVYRLRDSKPLVHPDIVTVSIALEKGAEQPRVEYPPVTVFRFSSECFSAGIEIHMLDGVSVRIYSPEKTLADCFKFRNTIGMDIVLEALKLYRQRTPMNLQRLMHYAALCRVTSVMKPYLEAIF